MTKTVRLTFPQRVAATKELEKHCTKGPDGYALYESGWDDDRVAAVLGQPYNKIHIRNIRRELLGNIRRSSEESSPEMEAVLFRLTLIEDYLTSKWPDWKDKVQGDLV